MGAGVNPYSTYLAAGFGLLSVVDEDAATSCDQRDRASQSNVARGADVLPNDRSYGFARSCVPATGPRYRRTILAFRYLSSLPNYAATTGALVQRKSLPSIHMRCNTTASLRAKATFARFKPRSLATRIAHAFRAENLVTRLRMMFAAS